MKLCGLKNDRKDKIVTLYVRVWIETYNLPDTAYVAEVTLYVRVWIETGATATLDSTDGSPST